jgi:hypothetical protein
MGDIPLGTGTISNSKLAPTMKLKQVVPAKLRVERWPATGADIAVERPSFRILLNIERNIQ